MQVDYKMLTLLLAGNQVAHSPAELHGLLTGQLCSGVAAPDPDDLGELLDQHQHLTPVVSKLIERLLREATEQLTHLDYHFHPLLPSDETPLQERIVAIGTWCDSFMIGFAAGFIRPDSALSPEAREILGDFGQFAAISDENEELTDQDEVDYMELIEYVRMAAITLFQQLASPPPIPQDQQPEPEPDDGFIH